MPRHAQKAADDSFSIWVESVDKYNRVRLPLEISTVVPWIDPNGGPIECIAIPGPSGGIQLVPLAEHRRDVARFADAIAGSLPSASDSPETWVDLARFLATACPIPINVEANRISITLPEPLRKAQQLPQSGGTVVVFGFGGIIEIWDAPKWHDHVRATAKSKTAALSEALEDLRHR